MIILMRVQGFSPEGDYAVVVVAANTVSRTLAQFRYKDDAILYSRSSAALEQDKRLIERYGELSPEEVLTGIVEKCCDSFREFGKTKLVQE